MSESVIRDRGWQSQRPIHVRFASKAAAEPSHCNPPLCAKSGCEQSQQELLFDHLVGDGE
jgi:hypothetical protein